MIPTSASRYRAPPVTTKITIVSSAHNGMQADSGHSVAIPAPAGIVAGNLLLAVFSCDDGTFPTTISCPGWTLLTNYTFTTRNNTGIIGAFYKIASASEPASYTFTGTQVYAMNIGIIQLAGVNQADPFGGVAPTVYKAAAALNPVFPPITLPKSMHIMQVCAQGGNYTNAVSNAYTPPAGYTIAVQSITQYNSAAIWDSEATFAALSNDMQAAGVVTPPSGTFQKSYLYGSLSIALNPA
ncbi:hypothetical protein [Cupriavidus sp. Marseille-Q8015]